LLQISNFSLFVHLFISDFVLYLASEKKTHMTVLAVALLILVAKEFLVFNAETLVLICFVLFIGMLTTTLRTSVIDGFQARADSIKKLINVQRELKKQANHRYHADLKTQTEMAKELSSYKVLYTTAKKALVVTADRRLKLRINTQLSEKLRRIATLEARAYTEMQREIAHRLPEDVRQEFKSYDLATKEKVLVSSIAALASNA